VGADFQELLATALQSFASFNACDQIDPAHPRLENSVNMPC
jgi:hypothetical protein